MAQACVKACFRQLISTVDVETLKDWRDTAHNECLKMKRWFRLALPCALLSVSFSFGQVNGEAFTIAEYLSTAHINGSLSYWGREACDFSFSESYAPVPSVQSAKASGRPIAEQLQEMFADDPNMKVIQEPGGIVRMFETDVPRDILEIKIHHISFDVPDAHGPNMAIRVILASPEVERFRKAHKIGPFSEFFRVPSDAGDHNPSVSGTLDNVTVSQALDYIFKTYSGFWMYGNCPNGGKSAERAVYFWFYRTFPRK